MSTLRGKTKESAAEVRESTYERMTREGVYPNPLPPPPPVTPRRAPAPTPPALQFDNDDPRTPKVRREALQRDIDAPPRLRSFPEKVKRAVRAAARVLAPATEDAGKDALKVFEPREVARLFLADGPAGEQHLTYWRGDFWRWSGTHYARVALQELAAEIARFIEGRKWESSARNALEPISPSATLTTVRNTIQSLSGLCVLSGDMEPPVWRDGRPAGELLAFNNGLLDVASFVAACDAGTVNGLQLQAHTPELFSLTAHDYDWNTDIAFPSWTAFLERVLPDSTAQYLVAQWAGYLFLPSQAEQRLLVCCGDGANGKSTLMAAIRLLLGPENCAAAPLEQLHLPHALEPLAGKLVCLCSEWGHLDQVGLAVLKAVSGGDAVAINPKYRSPYEAVLPTRFMVSCNTPPRMADPSDALWRRLMVLNFPVQIPEAEQRPMGELLERFKAELPGIAFWALIGFWRLRSEGGFAISEDMRGATVDLRADSNPAATFCQDHLEAEGACEAALSAVYRAYQDFCQANGHRPLARNSLTREVTRWFKQNTGHDPIVERRRLGGPRVRILKGVRLLEGNP